MMRISLLVFILLCTFQYINHIDAQDAASMMYGVNLGGWLVLESFIRPGLFRAANDSRVVDQWTFCEFTKNDPNKSHLLVEHFESWVTEQDIMNLSNAGITHLRIPVGYWMAMSQEELDFYKEPFVNGTWKYFNRAVKWAKRNNMKVILDLHAAPGSQNSWDHSGRRGSADWGKNDTIERTLELLERLAIRVKHYANDTQRRDTVVGIGVLNEPAPFFLEGGLNLIKSYSLQAYEVVRRHLPDVYVILDEAFSPSYEWNNFMMPPNYTNVVIDLHTYQCFDGWLAQQPDATHIDVACNSAFGKVDGHLHPTFTGEWSLAYQSPYVGVEPYPQTEEKKLFLKRYGMAQRSSYEKAGRSLGWFFWNFKTEDAIVWDYLGGVNGGWLPCQLPTLDDDRIVCGNVTDTSTVPSLYSCTENSTTGI